MEIQCGVFSVGEVLYKGKGEGANIVRDFKLRRKYSMC